MAINLTYDPSDDPQTLEAEDQRDAESLETADKLQAEEEQLLAGKYKDAEELESAYLELQKKLGSKDDTSEEQPESTVDEEEKDDPLLDNELAKTLVTANDEFYEKGELTPETVEALSQMDSRELVNTWVELQDRFSDNTESTELSEESINQMHQAVGGEESYQNLIGWAQDNFTQQEISAYDKAIDSGILDTINFALQALYYRYQDSNGYEGEMIQGKSPTRSTDVFRSQAEVVRAMSDPMYDNDPAYRQDVFDKIERSNINF